MSADPTTTPITASRLGRDFWLFWSGQSVSNLGNAVGLFALPLLIFKLTGSALNLALVTAAQTLPYLLFGLAIGAWVDRTHRRRLMIATDLLRAVVVASLPLLAALDALAVWWVYAVAFVNATFAICFDSAQFAAIPSLVGGDDLITANGRIQASFSTAMVLGPLLAGALIGVVSVETVLLVDALSFLGSALSLALVRRGFNVPRDESRPATSLRRDVVEGLRYVLGHPVLRNISLMMALVNFVGSTTYTQVVLFADERLGADDALIGWLFAADSGGVVLCALAAGWLRRRWSFSRVALGALMLSGGLSVLLALTTQYWLALPIWAAYCGVGMIFNINTGSLRQAIVPNHLLGRVISIAGVLALSAIPLGTVLGGLAIERTGNVALVYGAIGVLTSLIAFAFAFTTLGRADRYLKPEPAPLSLDHAEAAD